MEYYQLMVYALIAGFVLVFWKAAQWTLASTRAARDSESLTPADLQALQEACEGLIADLREVADEATARVNLAVQKAEIIVSKLDESIPIESILAQVTGRTAARCGSGIAEQGAAGGHIEHRRPHAAHLSSGGPGAFGGRYRCPGGTFTRRGPPDPRSAHAADGEPGRLTFGQQWFCRSGPNGQAGCSGEMKDCPENSYRASVPRRLPSFRGQAAFLRGAVPGYPRNRAL